MSQDAPTLDDPGASGPTPVGEIAEEELALEHGMTSEEYARVCDILDRKPTVTELGMFSVMWSEHCSYKSSRVHLRNLPTMGERVLEGPGENAGAVDLGDGWAGVFKVESHNHPSFIEPYQGAATGVGGILRDIFTMGARPLALLNSLRFGPLDRSKNRWLLDGVVAGIAGYGNSIGVPTVGGEVYFDPSYDRNPLVNVMCYGLAPADGIVRARASGVGNPVIYVGAKTGRDGIYGVSLLASATFDEEAEEKRPAVQVGDPFTEKLLLESCLELIEQGLVVGMQDMGGAGLTCSSCEMGSKSNTGVSVDVRKVPARERGMTPYEFMLSESQERMLLVCEHEHVEEVQAVFDEWDLHAVVVGEVTDDGMVTVTDGDEVVARIPARALADDGPVYERPVERADPPSPLDPGDLPGSVDAVAETLGRASGGAGSDGSGMTAGDGSGSEGRGRPRDEGEACRRMLLELLTDPCIASKRWVFQQYDQTVRTNTVQRPGGDAAVIRMKETGGAVALSLDGNPFYTSMDAHGGAALAVAEACRNVACTGARPLGITNCLNFGSPEVPRRMAEFADAVRGMADACRALGVPVTGGNVSFYNQTDERSILPTPVVGCLGHMDDAERSVPAAFQGPGDAVVLLGCETGAMAGVDGGPVDWGLGGSALVRRFFGGRDAAPPALDLEREAALQAVLVEAAAAGLLVSAHDCSDGGLGVALAEACFGRADGSRADGRQGIDAEVGNGEAGDEAGDVDRAGGAAGREGGHVGPGAGLLGARVDLGPAAVGRADVRLFGEAASRAVVSVAPGRVDELLALARTHDLPASRLGSVDEAPRLSVSLEDDELFTVPVAELYRAWGESLASRMEGEWHAA